MISIHHNSYASDHTVNYATALYYKDTDQLLASSILNSVALSLDIKNQGITKFDNSLLWVADMPAVLTEAFFLTDKNSYNLLLQSKSTLLADEAQGIYQGIVNYFENPDQIVLATTNDTLLIDRNDLGD